MENYALKDFSHIATSSLKKTGTDSAHSKICRTVMDSVLIEYIYLILAILALVMLANKLKIAYPIVLVLGGIAVSFTPFFTNITINPELVFFIFLPPLLYEAAWQISWKEFWKWRRSITSFAFPIVILNACVIAYLSNALIPGFTLALGFLLGGIISPPDAISATTIMRQVKAPRVLLSIAEGESLLNDASSLIVFRFALIAVVSGQFHFQEALASFFIVVLMGMVIGLGIGLIFYAIHRWLPLTPNIEIILTFTTPYCMYYFAEHYHFSGVLSVVTGGLFLASKRRQLLNYASRIQGINVWNSMVFLLNGLIFLLIGLQLPFISQGLGKVSLGHAIWYGLAISLALILTRILLTLGASVFTHWISRFITVAEVNPGWKLPLIFGWAGTRGVVSLAMALSIPLLGHESQQFPYRNLILFITFIVILITLVFQGLTLPWLIRILHPEASQDTISAREQEKIIQKKLTAYALQYLKEDHNRQLMKNKLIKNLKGKLELELGNLEPEFEILNSKNQMAQDEYHRVFLELLERQRNLLDSINKHSEFDEELIRKHHALIDLEEHKIRSASNQAAS